MVTGVDRARMSSREAGLCCSPHSQEHREDSRTAGSHCSETAGSDPHTQLPHMGVSASLCPSFQLEVQECHWQLWERCVSD